MMRVSRFARAFNRMPHSLRKRVLLIPQLFSREWVSQIGAFAITGKQFASWEASYLPVAHAELADLTMVAGTVTSAVQNTGVVGLKWVRVKARLKTLGGLAATNTVRISVQAGTGAAVTNPVQIAQQLLTMETNDTELLFQFIGWSEAGFQSYRVIITSSNGAAVSVVDVMVDAA